MRLAAAYFINPVTGFGTSCVASPTMDVTYMGSLQAVRLKPDGLPATLVPLHNVVSIDFPPEPL